MYCCCFSVPQLCLILCDSVDCRSPGLPDPHDLPSLPNFMFISSVMLSSHLFLWGPLLLLPSIFPSFRDVTNKLSIYIRCPKYWSFCFSISPSSEYSGLISLKMTDLISLQSKGLSGVFFSTIVWKRQFFWHSTLFTVQLSQAWMITGKTIALAIQTFVCRVMSLIFNTLSRFVIAFLPRSNRLLISWLQSPSAVILEPKRRKSVTTSTFSPSICNANRCLIPWALFVCLFVLIFSLKLALALSSFTLIKKLFSSSLLSAIRVVSSEYTRLLMFLPPILIPACNSSSLAFLMMCSGWQQTALS